MRQEIEADQPREEASLLAMETSESGDAHRHVGPLSTIANLPAWLDVGRVMPRATAVAWRGRNRRRNDPVPAMRPAPTTFAAVLFDELAVTIALLRRSGADMLDFSAARRDAERAVTVLDGSGALDDPLSLHPAPGPPTAVRLTRRVRPGVRFEHLSFESTYVPPQGLPARPEWFEDGANQIAHAYVLRHDGPRPWIVVLHPYAMGEPRDLLFAGSVTLHRELGVNVLHPVIPRHGPRARTQSALFFPSADPLTNLYGFSQAIRDIRQATAWARLQGATAIGVHGVSLGGFMTALLAGLEPGLDVVTAGEPPVEFVRLIAGHVRRIRGEQAEIVGYSCEEAVRTLGRLASPLGYEPLVPWSRRYIYAAVGDRFAPPSHAADLWRHWDNPEIVWHQGSHISGVMARPWRRLLRAALRDAGVIASRA